MAIEMCADFNPYCDENWRLLPTGSEIQVADVLHVERGSPWIIVDEETELRGVRFVGRRLEVWNPLVFRQKTPDELHLEWNLRNETGHA